MRTWTGHGLRGTRKYSSSSKTYEFELSPVLGILWWQLIPRWLQREERVCDDHTEVALVTEFRACQYRLYGLFSTKFPEGPDCVFTALRPLKPMAFQYICLSCFTLPTAHAQGPAQRRLSGVLLSFLFEWSNCLRCNQWDTVPAGFSIRLTCPQHSLSTSLFSGVARYFRLSWYFLYPPWPWNQPLL